MACLSMAHELHILPKLRVQAVILLGLSGLEFGLHRKKYESCLLYTSLRKLLLT